MNNRTILTFLITCVGLLISAGCATDMARSNYDNKLTSAYSQLEAGKHEQVLKILKAADNIAKENSFEKTELTQLQIEAYLGLGDTVRAFTHASELLDKNSSGPYANELIGKVLLKDARYAEAEKHFVTAQQGYKFQDDILRVSDLLALTRGLSQYEIGNPKLAQRYFRDIQNVELQYAVDKAQKDMVLED